MGKNIQTLQEKVADFAKESGQPIFLIDYTLSERFDYDLDDITAHLVSTHPTIFDDNPEDYERYIDILKTSLKESHFSFHDKENGTKIIGFLDTPSDDFYLYEAAHKACPNPTGDDNSPIPEAKTIMIEAQDVWEDYVLYHELFHAIDPRLQSLTTKQDPEPSLKFRHQAEFFADFASCLYLASKGNNIFLDVAKKRSRDLQSSSLSSDFKQGQFAYSNHHIYAVFKKLEIDPIGLTIPDIVHITTAVTEKFAFDSQRLAGLAGFALDLDKKDIILRMTAMSTGTLSVIKRDR